MRCQLCRQLLQNQLPISGVQGLALPEARIFKKKPFTYLGNIAPQQTSNIITSLRPSKGVDSKCVIS
jgi:hypothetical protein